MMDIDAEIARETASDLAIGIRGLIDEEVEIGI